MKTVMTMALVGRRDGRNFGYGRQLSYAGPQALNDLFAGGHFATVKAHSDRWQAFVRWCRSVDGPGYSDARQIDQRTLQDYAAYLRQQIQQGEICIATAQNRLSSVNRTLAALRGDQDVRIASPSQALRQQRSNVRTRAPDGQDHQQVRQVFEALSEQQHERVAAIVLLARTTGMRLREAILADLPRLQLQAEHFGCINIQDGTKGGRSGASAPRWVDANEEVKAALQLARHASPPRSRNLLARDESYSVFLQQTVLPAREMLHEHGLKGFHELRAAYACERYEQLTGHAAPVNGGHCYRIDRDLDQQARQQISVELGHNRIDVISAYIGGRA
jgi:integrase